MSFGALVCVESVLASDAPTLAQANVIPEGLLLLRGLGSVFRLSLSTQEPEMDIAERFLTFAGIAPAEFDRILGPNEGEQPVAAFRRHVHLAGQAHDLAYVVTADPAAAKRCILMGVTPMLCPHPLYAASSFLPYAGEGAQAWTDMVEGLVEQKFLRSTDSRIEEDVESL